MRIGSSGGTPVPNREIEAKSSGSGPVITYRLSPEELERVRRGERLERKEDQPMSTTTALSVPDKLEVLRRLATGKKVCRIEDELGLKKGALQYWLGKWGLKGVKGEQAQQLLDKMLIDQSAEHKAEPAAEPEPVNSNTPVPESHPLTMGAVIEMQEKKLAEKAARIAELEAERKQNREEIERLRAANTQTVALAGQAAEKQLAEIERLKEDEETLSRLLTETENKLAEVIKERDALLQTVERAVDDGRGREVSSTEAIEAATAGLTGGLAYHTGAAIERLWCWQTVEDLRRARHHIDRLVDSVVLEGAAG